MAGKEFEDVSFNWAEEQIVHDRFFQVALLNLEQADWNHLPLLDKENNELETFPDV